MRNLREEATDEKISLLDYKWWLSTVSYKQVVVVYMIWIELSELKLIRPTIGDISGVDLPWNITINEIRRSKRRNNYWIPRFTAIKHLGFMQNNCSVKTIVPFYIWFKCIKTICIYVEIMPLIFHYMTVVITYLIRTLKPGTLFQLLACLKITLQWCIFWG